MGEKQRNNSRLRRMSSTEIVRLTPDNALAKAKDLGADLALRVRRSSTELISLEADKDRHARAAADTTEHEAGEQVVEGEEQTMAATKALTPSQKSKARTRRPLAKAPTRPRSPVPIQPDAPATADAAADSPTEPTSDPRNVAVATAEPAVNATTDDQPDAATESATDGGDGEEPHEDASLLQVETAPKVNAGTIIL